MTVGRALPLHRNRDYLLLWGGQAVSVVGTRVSAIAYPLLVLSLTGSPGIAGVVGFVATAPQIIVQLPAGAIVDRAGGRGMMLACDVGRCVALASVAVGLFAGRLTVAQILVVAAVEGTLSVFFNLGQTIAVRSVVAAPQIPAALSTNEARVRGAAMLGQPLGGLLFGVGQALPFVVDAASYAVSIVTLLLIRGRLRCQRSSTPGHLLDDVRAGAGWLWRQPFLRMASLLIAGSNLIFQALVLTLIVIVRERGAGPVLIGVVLGGAGLGGVLGALAAPWFQRHLPARLVVIGANWTWAAMLPLLAILPSPLLVGAVFGVMAFVGPAWNVVIGAYRLNETPEELLGRVLSAGTLLASGAAPLGSLAAGVLLSTAGTAGTAYTLAAAMALLALAATLSGGIRRGLGT